VDDFAVLDFAVVDFAVPDLAGAVLVWALLGRAVTVTTAAHKATAAKNAENFMVYSIKQGRIEIGGDRDYRLFPGSGPPLCSKRVA
jgi:hypothetical protein